ncbi:hypothetical protein LDENG_00021200 [Lucifuga dentata]|nr:hypothetical protein LDENG_00021200 [Lucifuga dentata]
MESDMLSSFASKTGITSARIIRQAEEYMRLSEVRCSALSNVTTRSKAVICLQLAAASMKHSLDKECAVRLSGLNKKQYQSSYRAMESLLGLESGLSLRETALQFGCIDAAKLAAQILERYVQSLPAAQQPDLDLTKPLFISAALCSACRCLKIKVDKKLAASSGAKKSMFDRLVVRLQSLGQNLCTEAAPVRPTQKRQNTQVESSKVEDDDSASSPKQQREDDENLPAVQDYEEWKRKILEKALKSTNSTE